MSLALGIERLQLGNKTLVEQAISILRRPGVTAHAYLPGIGSVNGLQTNNYTLSDGSSGYTSIDGAAGLVLDGMGSLGSELCGTTGDLTAWTGNNPDGWIVTENNTTTFVDQDANGARMRSTDGTNVQLQLGSGVILGIGKTFKATVVVYSIAAGNISVVNSSATLLMPVITAAGTYTFYFTSADGIVLFKRTSGISDFVIRSLKIQEVTGIHCQQPTTANKPLLVRGLRNLLTYSSDLTSAAWVVQGTASKSGSNVLVPAIGDAAYHSTVKAAIGTSTESFLLSGSGTASIYGWNATDGFIGVQQVTLTATPTVYASSFTSTAANTTIYVGRRTGDTATSITFGGAGLFQGTLSASDIIREGGIPITTSAAASNPSAGRYSWSFDGVNDSLALGSVPFQMSDDSYVCVGTRIDAPSGSYVVSTGGGGVFPAIGDIGFDAAYHPLALWRDDSGPGGQALIVHGASAQGSTVILETLKVGNAKSFYVNGVQSGATNNNVMGTATVTSTTIGSYGAGGSNHKGPISMGLMVKGTLTQADRITLSRFVALATPGAPSF